MRLRTLLACSFILPLVIACSEKHVIVQTTPAPAGSTPGEEDPTQAEEPAKKPVEEPKPTQTTEPGVIDLGEVTAGSDVPFTIPAGVLGFNITAESSFDDFDPNAPFGIQRITEPGGKIVHDNFTPNGGSHATSTAAFDTIASVSVPQSENAPANLAGNWKLRIGQEGVASSRIKVKTKIRLQSSGDGQFHGGKLDLHLHIPSGLMIDNRAVDPSKAETNADIKERLDTFFGLTKNLLGIERGDVVYHPEASTYAALDTDEKLLRGFGVSKGVKEGAQEFHILFTNEISRDGQPFAAGISPGIPGAAQVYGRSVSGIIVATSRSAEEDVLTMIHEAGHFFGLNHTTEFSGDAADPLSDTPKCTTIADRNLQACPDRANVMFAAGAIDGPVSLSATQKRIYRGSPIYKAFTSSTTKTQSLDSDPFDLGLVTTKSIKRHFRASDKPLTPIETELTVGFCGLSKIDARAIANRHGEAFTVNQLRTAASDPDLHPIMRGRANLALKDLGY